MKTDDGHGIRYFAIALREKIKSIFQSMQLGGDEYSVVTALLIGARDELDKGLWEEFKSAGVLHILCVSGMHVGLIYVVLSFLFSFMNRKHGLKIVRTILIIALIWLYALVTGMGPSVLRAATMFSFVTVGTTLQRMTGIYNTLIASALVLLVLNPFLLRDAGFQLSYAAVIGIVTLQKPLNRLLSVKWWLPARMWAITTVTLAAQIATFPLSLLYFHQFPVFFIPANMIVLPLSTLIIYTALVCLMLSPLAFITPLLSWILAFITHLMIGAVDMIDGLPGAVIRPIAMDAVCCILLYGVVIAAWKFIGSKKYVALFTGLLFILSIGALSLLRKTCQEQQHKIIVYSIPRQSAYDFIDGRNHLFFADSSLISDARKQDFYVRQGWTAMGLNRAENFTIEALSQQPLHQTSVFYQNRNFIQLEDIRIVILDRTFSRNMPVTPPVHVDIIIISNGAGISPGEIAGKFPAGHVIIDSSCDQWKVKRNLAGIDTLKAHLHRVSEEGSFIFEW
jgi:competence protein ComEC